MKNERNIDRLFQESFKDFEVSPPENAWQNIEYRLKAGSGNKVIPLWKRLTAVAAIIALILVGALQWYILPNNTTTPVTDNSTPILPVKNELKVNEVAPNQENSPAYIATSLNDITKNEKGEPTITQKTTIASTTLNSTPPSTEESSSAEAQSFALAKVNNSEPESQFKSDKSSISSKDANRKSVQIVSSAETSFPQNLNVTPLPENTVSSNSETELSLIEVAKVLALEDQKNNTKASKEKFKPSWYIKPNISPVFYGNLSSGSAVDESFSQNSSQGEVDLSYGLNVGYQLNKKVKIRTGINRVNLNYTTNDLFLLPNSEIYSMANVNSAGDVIASVVSTQQLDNLVDDQQFGRQEAIASDLRQSIGFIEFPLEVEYKLLDKKFGINIIGGASTFLLNDNSLDVINAQGTTTIGKANNINDLSFSTNLALGFDYSLSNSVLLNLEPTFKYQINTFQSGTTNFQPYFLGVYTGFIFKF